MRTSVIATALLTASLGLPVAAHARTASEGVNEPAASTSPRTPRVHLRSHAWEAKVVALTNARRQAHGVRPLKMATCPRHFAAHWARYMARTHTMVHHSSLSPLFGCLRSPRAAGENIAEGYESARAVVRAWMSDKGHRDNILDPAFRRIGVAGARVGHGPTYAIQDFVG